MIGEFKYRPEIDGLRALAVVPVVLYHAGLGWPGGFVGVDVFFVISGFLITSLIVKEMQIGEFSFLAFWERRARRIIPALAGVAFFTLFAGAALLLPVQYSDLGKSTIYLGAGLANVYFYLGTGYFAGASDEKPLLHTWSLAVEEQFYLLLPIGLYVLFRAVGRIQRRTLLFIFGAGIVTSFALSLYVVPKHAAAGFFLLPTRAWELLIGAFVALIPSASVNVGRGLRELTVAAGLLAIVIPGWVYSKDTVFPGLAALPPCLGAGLVILAGSSAAGEQRAPRSVSRLISIMASRPIVFIGLISYSLYLWHWPLIAFGNYWELEPHGHVFKVGVVLVGLATAILSWRFIETPFRQRRYCGSRRSLFIVAGCAGVVVVLFGALVVRFQGMNFRMPSELENTYPQRLSDDFEFVHNTTIAEIESNRLPRIGVDDAGVNVSLLVWGDSHAMAAMPAFDALCRKRGLSGRAATYSSHAPLLNWYGDDAEASRRLNEAVFQYIQEKQIRDVFLVACWIDYDLAASRERFEAAALDTVSMLVRAGSRPWVVLMVPNHRYDVPKAIAYATVFRRDEGAYASKPGQWSGIPDESGALVRKLEAAGARVIDPRPAFLDPETGRYKLTVGGRSLYRDEHHLSKAGALTILLPVLENSFGQVDTGTAVRP